MKQILTSLIAVGLSTAAAIAGPLTIANPGFDADPLPDGGFTCSGTSGFTSWNSFGNGCGTGLFNPSSSAYPGGLAPSGNNVVYENGISGYWQSLSDTYQLGQTVTFSLLVGQRLDASYAGYVLQLYAGNTPVGAPLATISNFVTPPTAGTFVPVSISFFVTNPTLVGQRIIVAFSGSTLGIQTNFDNASGNSTSSVPEPGTYALIGAALIPIAALRRKRRR